MSVEVDVVTAYWTAAEERDWDAFGALVAEDVVYEAPQSRERVRGRNAYVRFNREGCPGDWHLRMVLEPLRDLAHQHEGEDGER
jgi:ketosteroid isomerase-like protein